MKELQKQQWYENESFWRTFAPEMFTEDRLKVTGDEIDQVMMLLDIQPNAKILDLCCGMGRHSLELVRRGFKVVGVDLTAEYLAEARKQAQNEGLDIEFVKSDMRQFCLIEEFDVVINMFTAFGYFEEVTDDRRVLANAYYSLRKGGKMIIDLMGKEVLARIFQPREWRDLNGRIFLRQSRITRNWSWCENRWMIVENGKRKEYNFGHRIYSAVELSDLLKSVGFAQVSTYGDLDGSDYNHNAKRLIVVAEK